MRFILTTFLLISSVFSYAQKLYFCEGHSSSGTPRKVHNEWEYNEDGTKVTFLYNNGPTTMDFPKLFFLIEKPGQAEPVDKVELNVFQHRNWAAMEYTFEQAGTFMVSVFGRDNKVLASNKIVLKSEAKEVEKVEITTPPKMSDKKEANKEKETEADLIASSTKEVANKELLETKEAEKVLYYDNSMITFCELYKEGEKVNPAKSFNIKDKGVYVEIVVENGNTSLNTDKLIADIWKKSGDDYTEHIASKEAKVDSKNNLAHFHYSFFKPGNYKVSIFNEDMVWINTEYLTITKK